MGSAIGIGFDNFAIFEDEEPIKAILKMRYSDLVHVCDYWLDDPSYYMQFREAKNKFEKKITEGFFLPDATPTQVIKTGNGYHSQLLSYLLDKVEEEDLDF